MFFLTSANCQQEYQLAMPILNSLRHSNPAETDLRLSIQSSVYFEKNQMEKPAIWAWIMSMYSCNLWSIKMFQLKFYLTLRKGDLLVLWDAAALTCGYVWESSLGAGFVMFHRYGIRLHFSLKVLRSLSLLITSNFHLCITFRTRILINTRFLPASAGKAG